MTQCELILRMGSGKTKKKRGWIGGRRIFARILNEKAGDFQDAHAPRRNQFSV